MMMMKLGVELESGCRREVWAPSEAARGRKGPALGHECPDALAVELGFRNELGFRPPVCPSKQVVRLERLWAWRT